LIEIEYSWIEPLAGPISAEKALNYGFTGPNLRAAGVDYDVRVMPILIHLTKILNLLFQLERKAILTIDIMVRHGRNVAKL
jgi:Ni,Fe-hydrogenase III large subunit